VAQTHTSSTPAKGFEVTWIWKVNARAVRIDRRESRSVNLTPIVSEQKGWIDSLIGAFDDNPVYGRVIENAKAYRRELEEQLMASPPEGELVHPRQ
jgi:hypothetical protein